MPSPPMLRPRDAGRAPSRPDPLAAFTVAALALVAVALFIAAVLAVYTWATPDIELPLVIAITLAFVTVIAANLVRLAVRHLRAGH